MTRTFLAAGISAVFLFLSTTAEAQGFYPREWWQGRSGLFAPDYITPSADEPGFLTGGETRTRGGRIVFAAASVDQRCQQDGSPRIIVLDAPRGGSVSVDLGAFRASGVDAGSHFCVGRTVRGARVHYRGRAVRGDRLVLRVIYPVRGDAQLSRARTYDHVIPLR